MAYLTCPWCLTPQIVRDEAYEFRCYTCAAEVRFFKCLNCMLVQTVNKKWRSFTCGGCEQKIDLPYRWGYDPAATAMSVDGTGTSWSPL